MHGLALSGLCGGGGGGGGGGGLWAVSKVEGSTGAPCLPGSILMGGFNGALLVVSILGMVYDCHL